MAVADWLEDLWGEIQEGADELGDYWEQIERNQKQEEARERREAEESFRRANVRQQRMIGGDQWNAGNLGELAAPQPVQEVNQQGAGGLEAAGEVLQRIADTLDEMKDILEEIRDKEPQTGTYGA